MGQNDTTKILELFYEYPEREFTIREMAKLTGIPRATTHMVLMKLKKNKVITKNISANKDLLFATKKINFFVENIVSSGLIDELINKLNPSCIILFGSIRKGESVKESDIDIFVESSVKRSINLKNFEKRLKHKIQIFVENDIHKLPPNLFNNVVNGIKLYGSFKIK
ncbi:nucleotidyltransferase domain-containing protein [Candidatus Pacearchaeota archaeon]|nr:nucleotidyltransferase domain-containing protein [Candidatus Pacearchaeota archaeon]